MISCLHEHFLGDQLFPTPPLDFHLVFWGRRRASRADQNFLESSGPGEKAVAC